jgi:hypothetical protein
LPEHERRYLLKQEETRRRFELREAKINIWKKWRRKKQENQQEIQEEDKKKSTIWLEKLEETLARMKKETHGRSAAKEMELERRKKLMDERKERQDDMLRQEQEKRERKIKKKMLEERWEMTRWITRYIDENSEKWERESDWTRGYRNEDSVQ